MQQSEFIAKVAEKSGLKKDEAAAAIKAVETVIAEGIAAGEDVRLANFLTFKKQVRAARKGKNPSTGAPLDIPEKTLIKVVPAKRFTEAALGA